MREAGVCWLWDKCGMAKIKTREFRRYAHRWHSYWCVISVVSAYVPSNKLVPH